MTDMNYWAILVSAIASMVIGSIWYGPLFGKQFMQATGMDKWSPEKQAAMKKSMGVTYFMQFIASLVMFFVLARLMGISSQMTLNGGLTTAVWVWIGFVVPVKLGDAIWGGKMSMFWLGSGNMLLTLLATGAILGGWR